MMTKKMKNYLLLQKYFKEQSDRSRSTAIENSCSKITGRVYTVTRGRRIYSGPYTKEKKTPLPLPLRLTYDVPGQPLYQPVIANAYTLSAIPSSQPPQTLMLIYHAWQFYSQYLN